MRTATRRARFKGALVAGAFISAVLLAPSSSRAEPVTVQHTEGLAHGFLVLKTVEGATIADGDLIQTASGTRVTTRLLLRFKDGSKHDETTVYTQEKTFRLLSSHVVQSGPSFNKVKESTIDVRRGLVTVRYTDDDGKEVVSEDHPELPADLANGMTMVLLKNISPETPKTTVSMLGFTPKPQMVQLEISASGEEPFSIDGTSRKAIRYVAKVHVPGFTGVLASVFGKVPPDSRIWILGGEAPAFVAAETPLFSGGPQWRIELASPQWPSFAKAAAKEREKKRAPAARTAKTRSSPAGK